MRVLLLLIPVGLVAAAVALPELNENLTSSTGCAATEERPCYDQGTKNKLKIFKDNAGESAFSACMSNGAENLTGSVSLESNICAEEVVTYCFLGNSNNFIRKFDGTCELEIPDLSTVNIEGRFIDGVTDEPIANVRVWDPEVGINNALDVSNSNGEFAFTTDTTAVTQTAGNQTGYSTGRCYFENWGLTSILRNNDDTLRLSAVLFDFIPGNFLLDPILSPDVDLGEVTLWPATGLSLSSDIPVKLTVPYEEEDKSLGNTQLRTAHKLSNAIPLEQPVSVILTDSSGNEYVSPSKTYPIDKGCSTAVLTFQNGEFNWQD